MLSKCLNGTGRRNEEHLKSETIDTMPDAGPHLRQVNLTTNIVWIRRVTGASFTKPISYHQAMHTAKRTLCTFHLTLTGSRASGHGEPCSIYWDLCTSQAAILVEIY